ncbi:MAG: hypothetical protein C0501_25515 [Isosphaera sp.]|nr:hypothetical protein [Isosphaera sp.]
MFKSVEYAGFDGRPELRAKAERLTPVLGEVVKAWRDQVEVTWRPAPPEDSRTALELTLSLALWNAAGSATGAVRRKALEPGEEGDLRSDLRWVWMDLLAVLSDRQMERLDEYLREPLEA